MNIRISITLVLLPLLCFLTNNVLSQSERKLSDSAAQNKGIVFEHGLNWRQVLDKAKAEDKYVFVDCYTTWCGPCKAMDKEVYVDDSVGKFMNDKFICVKVQMDSTGVDTKEVQAWYRTARQLKEDYSIHEYPSFLFFSVDGLIAYKYVGARGKALFLGIANTGLNSSQEEYTLAYQKYKQGELDYREMPSVAKAAIKIGLDSVGQEIARDYITNYLPNITPDQLWTKDNLSFIRSYVTVLHSKDKTFRLYFRDRKSIDSIMGKPGYSNKVINSVIFNDEFMPKIQVAVTNHTEPKWKGLEKLIERKYGNAFVEKNLLDGRVEFYRDAQQWHKYARYFVIQSEKNGVDRYTRGTIAAVVLNNIAYEVFKYTDSKKDLKKALSWVERSISIDPGVSAPALDTKANILYRMGKTQEGLTLEQKSVSLNPNDKEAQENLKKMKDGLPTWVM